MSTSAPRACSSCYGTGIDVSGQVCPCGVLQYRIMHESPEQVSHSFVSEAVRLRAENQTQAERIKELEQLIREVAVPALEAVLAYDNPEYGFSSTVEDTVDEAVIKLKEAVK